VGLTREEAVAYDTASALGGGSPLPDLLYRQAVQTFGEEGTAELINLVGFYCLISVILNGFDVPVPETAGAVRKSSRDATGGLNRLGQPISPAVTS
jgi:hypothetical protein